MIKIQDELSISEEALVFTGSRSSGPGGQHVNKVNTRVTVFFDVAGCGSFTTAQKRRILTRLATRANKKGVIHVAAQRYRGQRANRQEALERLVTLLQQALARPKVRKQTKVSRQAKAQRRADKKHRSQLKQRRGENFFAADDES